MSTLLRLRRVFNEELGLDESQDPEGFSYGVNPEWDSVAHFQLIVALEAEFGIEIDDQQVAELTSFSKLLSGVERQLNG